MKLQELKPFKHRVIILPSDIPLKIYFRKLMPFFLNNNMCLHKLKENIRSDNQWFDGYLRKLMFYLEPI